MVMVLKVAKDGVGKAKKKISKKEVEINNLIVFFIY
jgi:hypothetical protein